MQAPSIELTYNELKEVMLSIGFELEVRISRRCQLRLLTIVSHPQGDKIDQESTYNSSPASMLQSVYKCVYFVARKPLTTAAGETQTQKA